VYAKLQHAAIQTGKELVTGADSIGWHVQDSLVRMTYGDEVLDAAEWQVKIVSRPTQRSECVRYEGSRYCRIQEGPGQKARFFRPMFRVEGMVICDETGRVMSLVRGRMRWLYTILEVCCMVHGETNTGLYFTEYCAWQRLREVSWQDGDAARSIRRCCHAHVLHVNQKQERAKSLYRRVLPGRQRCICISLKSCRVIGEA
jgi:hypothetical protein